MKKFLTIWAGELVSNIGSGMTAFALSVYVLQLTGSVTWVSVVTMLAYLPTILLSPIGGLLADRFDRRLMMICGDLFSALGLVYILVSIKTGHGGLAPILVGVVVNSVFISLLDPSYKATVTDLLTSEEYAKASGLVQMASNAKYLVSPALAGLLLGIADISVILMIDICTIFVTVFAVMSVRKSIAAVKPKSDTFHFIAEMKEGLRTITSNKGVLLLVVLMAFMCFFIGFIQTLMIPMVLPLSDTRTVGIFESVSAVGMLAGSVAIGIRGIKRHHAKILVVALVFCGGFMALTGCSTNLLFILVACVLFFATLPFVNTCADVLIRVSIPNETQGRAWGMISLLTQIGYVAVYASCGVLADHMFEPMLQKNGALAQSVGRIIGTGAGRGIGFMLMLAGLAMVVVAFALGNCASIQAIEVRDR
ncbi:MAG: MFS transporter [Sphaerochaetaceae bacterium]|nr:MFS transporter [Sphaerochaetaceae bacterium]